MTNKNNVISRLHGYDAAEFEGIFRHYWPELNRLGLKYGIDPNDVKDVVMDTFVALLINLSKFNSYEHIKGFLIITFENKARDFIKLRTRETARHIEYDYREKYQQASDEDKAVVEYFSRRLPAYLKHLSPQQKEVMKLILSEVKLTDPQIADQLGIKTEHVQAVRYIAKKALGEMLKEELKANKEIYTLLIPTLLKLLLTN